jgi:phosphonate transport system ATP-binding protein
MELSAVHTEPVVQAHRVSKSFGAARVLNDVNFEIKRGEMVGLIGASGSGKSTLIRTIAGLTAIDRCKNRGEADSEGLGEIRLFSQAIQQRGRVASCAKALRLRTGVIFQQFNLVPRLSVLTNVCLGLLGRLPFLQATLGQFTMDEKRRAMQALTRVGIAEHALKRGCDLSGGQQQRAAIARALVQGAEFFIADEPIASLDPHSARRVMDILADLNQRDGIAVLISLHQVEYALRYCSRIIALKAGEIVYDGPSRALTPDFLCGIYGAESQDLFGSIEPVPLPANVLHLEPVAVAREQAAAIDLPRRAPDDARLRAHA